LPLALIAVIAVASVTFFWRSEESIAYAFVDDLAITRDDYEAYAAVFTRPDGALLVSRDQVLLSLINQAIVEREAERRSISVADAAIAAGVGAWESLGIAEKSLERSGGRPALAARMRMFELFKLVRSAVVPPVEISSEVLEAEYQADESLHVLGLEAAMPVIRERLSREQVENRWEEWLRSQRGCAVIRVLDSSFEVPSTTPGPRCPGA
jgi:hypothetical protein